jgi:enamine deaminase RidA (YjgF/YER057c/UK114 family)
MMTIQRFDCGPRMCRVVVHNDTVYLAGLTADATAGQSVGEQTKEILAKIDGLLKQGGTDKSKLLQAVIWLQDVRTVDEFNKGVGRLGGAGRRSGARLHRGAAAVAGQDDRDHGDGGEVGLSLG